MADSKIVMMEFENNANIGLYMFANDKFCLLGKEVTKDKKAEIESVLKVPVYNVSVLSTELVGVFITGNNDFLFVPSIYSEELSQLREICEKHEVDIVEFDDTQNTFGNTVFFVDGKIVLNNEFKKATIDKIVKATKYEVIKFHNETYKAVGGICKSLKGKVFVSHELEEEDLEGFKDEVCGAGSINSGSEYISSGVVGNSNGLILGSMCSTVEIQNIVEGFDYL